jgi:hypothetical protein
VKVFGYDRAVSRAELVEDDPLPALKREMASRVRDLAFGDFVVPFHASVDVGDVFAGLLNGRLKR